MHADGDTLIVSQLYEATLAVDPALEEAAAAIAQRQAESHAPPPLFADQQVCWMVHGSVQSCTLQMTSC